MSLDEDQAKWLQELLDMCNDAAQKLTEWESSFINDTRERYEKYGADTRISPKQKAILVRIYEKLA